MNAFRLAIDSCNLDDLGFSGFQFTWSNGQEDDDNIQERLDRCLANSQWVDLFPENAVEHLVRLQSDHCPIWMTWYKRPNFNIRRKRRPYRFEAMWLQDESCQEVVRNTWESRVTASTTCDLKRKLNDVASALKGWEHKSFGNISSRIQELRNSIERIQQSNPSSENLNQAKVWEEELRSILHKEEIMWKQRSRANWLAEGDQNTTFFHRMATGRRKRNSIQRIKSSNDQWEDDPNVVEAIFLDYFHGIFTSEATNSDEDIMEAIPSKISLETSIALERNYTAEEVLLALNQTHPLKAPGPDGTPALFYTKFWSVVKDDLLAVVLDILNNGASPEHINQTHIVLIPKKKQPELPKDFRPISLCNVAFKLVTKCITNRLKPILPSLIHHAQSAFVPGRLITDNALIAFEMFHAMKTNKSLRQSSFSLKLDMAKAFDRVEWSFLSKVMTRLGFPCSLIYLVQRCISSVSYSILIDGRSTKCFRPSRGLRQGDPLSPFLFLFCAEAFSALIHRAEMVGSLHGARICRRAPAISHLFFADDSIIFGRANQAEIETVKDIINKYSRASGQRVNFDKSEISFSKILATDQQTHLGSCCGVPVVSKHAIYLGLPASMGRAKKSVFSCIEERVAKKLKNWKTRTLSQAGRMILIKTVAQAIPSYTMSCFLIPKTTLKRIDQIIASFWWGQKGNEKKIHWCKWDTSCSSKSTGGVGFRDLECFNLGFLAKQGWRILTNPDSALSQCLKARYFPRDSFLEAQLGYAPSFTWRSILAGRKIIKEGVRWNIRNGRSVRIWKDPWLPSTPVALAPCPNQAEADDQKVRDLFNNDGISWNIPYVYSIFPPATAELVISIPISSSDQDDCLQWIFSKDGRFSVKSAYWTAKRMKDVSSSKPSSSSNNSMPWKWFWNLHVPPKVKAFVWRCMRGILPTKNLLLSRGLSIDPICSRCGSAIEDLEHVLRDCAWVSFFWRASALRLPDPSLVPPFSIQDWILLSIKDKEAEFIELFVMLLWVVWKARNSLVFRQTTLSHLQCFAMAHSLLSDFTSRNQAPAPLLKFSPPGRWTPPPSEWFKLNSDASLADHGCAGFGGSVRDHSRSVRFIFSGFLPHCVEIELAEAIACKQGLLSAIGMGCRAVAIELDNQNIVSMLQKKLVPCSQVGTVIADILHLAQALDHYSFCWVPRSCNSFANEIARLARNPAFVAVSFASLPVSLRRIAALDAASSF